MTRDNFGITIGDAALWCQAVEAIVAPGVNLTLAKNVPKRVSKLSGMAKGGVEVKQWIVKQTPKKNKEKQTISSKKKGQTLGYILCLYTSFTRSI